MYRIYLIDDEDEVREGIIGKTDWAAFGFELAGAFGNGKDALEAAEAGPPDLVITDICMPFMDGLELTKRLGERYRDIKTVILTGYEDFEYAKRAISLKVHEYLLKPINFQEFSDLLARLKRELDEERERREDLQRLRLQLNESLPLLREKFLERLVTTSVNGEEIERKFRMFGISLKGPAYLALVMDIDEPAGEATGGKETERELLRFGAANIVQEIFGQEGGGLVFGTKDEKTAILFSGAPETCFVTAQSLAEQAAYCIEKYLKLRVSFGIGRIRDRISNLSSSYLEAISALDYRFLLGKNRIIAIDDVEKGRNRHRNGYAEWEKKLISAMKTGDEKAFAARIAEWIEQLKETLPSAEKGYASIQRFLVSVMNLIEETGYGEEAFEAARPFAHILTLKTLDDIKDWLTDLGLAVIRQMECLRSNEAHSHLRRAEAFIRENYSDPGLSLQHAAQKACMSMNYFSAMFKQYSGETFVEYLTRIRLEKAKELLAGTALKTYEIAERVGYEDPQYFSVIFKRNVGMTPKEFRAAAKEGKAG
ncbi:MAG: DNA-binding response regulator [Cohnella sp.]|uniref:helix-turn-helix domain-containing protein n=1 Tax=Cohnella sp. TaxID=1883426 RepID=UPI000E3A6DF7|nr:helix-turn-helix domain-containing protein [Cohnella sp.]REK62493.1 MAG: DNA-binding response regulator [Cohnella sp.]